MYEDNDDTIDTAPAGTYPDEMVSPVVPMPTAQSRRPPIPHRNPILSVTP